MCWCESIPNTIECSWCVLIYGILFSTRSSCVELVFFLDFIFSFAVINQEIRSMCKWKSDIHNSTFGVNVWGKNGFNSLWHCGFLSFFPSQFPLLCFTWQHRERTIVLRHKIRQKWKSPHALHTTHPSQCIEEPIKSANTRIDNRWKTNHCHISYSNSYARWRLLRTTKLSTWFLHILPCFTGNWLKTNRIVRKNHMKCGLYQWSLICELVRSHWGYIRMCAWWYSILRWYALEPTISQFIAFVIVLKAIQTNVLLLLLDWDIPKIKPNFILTEFFYSFYSHLAINAVNKYHSIANVYVCMWVHIRTILWRHYNITKIVNDNRSTYFGSFSYSFTCTVCCVFYKQTYVCVRARDSAHSQ